MFDFIGTLLSPLEWVVAWIMVNVHAGLTAVGMPAASGWTWALSIVGLVVAIRIVLIPLFVKQIKASRGMQLLQPEMRKIQAKYKDKKDPASREAMSRETMELYRTSGTNPFASCLPIVLQAPVFFALFRVLNYGIRNGTGVGPLTTELASQADRATIFGVSLSSSFLGSPELSTKVLAAVLIVVMSATTFTTQRQLMTKNMPASALDNPYAQQQKLIMYVFPIIFAVSGVNFPIGVLLYWVTTNAWTGGQQFYVIRRMPAPGSKAEAALAERRARRGRAAPVSPAPGGAETVVGQVVEPARASGQRVQPKRKDRARPGGATSGSSTATGPTTGSTPAARATSGSGAPAAPAPRTAGSAARTSRTTSTTATKGGRAR